MSSDSPTNRLGLWIAIAALCVNAPRLVQAFLEADGLQLNPQLRPVLMGATGVAAALTLTGGGAWLAHELARGADRLQGLLLTCWSLVLVGQLVLIPPLLMAEMATSRLGTVLPQSWQRWGWAFVAVLLVEVVAAGAMVAQGRRSQGQEERAREVAELERMAFQRADLERQLRSRSQEVSDLRRQLAEVEVTPPGGQELGQLKTSQGSQLAELPDQIPCRNGCGWVGRSPRAECGHQRVCKGKNGT
jgi:hypothetical protein